MLCYMIHIPKPIELHFTLLLLLLLCDKFEKSYIYAYNTLKEKSMDFAGEGVSVTVLFYLIP